VTTPQRKLARRWRFRWVRRGASLLAFLAVLEYFVLPQVSGSRNALRLIGDVQPGWLVLGVGLEILSLASYAALTRSVLPAPRPSFSWLWRADLSSLGVGNVVPGGAATAGTLRYRLLRHGGVAAEDALISATVQGIGSAVVLNVLLWLALVVSIPQFGFSPLYAAAAALGAALLGCVGVLIVAVLRGSDRILQHADKVAVKLLPKRLAGPAQRLVANLVAGLEELLRDRRRLTQAMSWAAANWLLDAASLWVFLLAFGHPTNVDGLLVAYGLAYVLAVIPISPGGLGIIEAVLIPSLVGFGTPRGIATLGVVTWRLFNFWAPIPVGGLAYLSLRAERWRTRHGAGEWWRAAISFFGIKISPAETDDWVAVDDQVPAPEQTPPKEVGVGKLDRIRPDTH
jgi:uncharacterized protein (TIRG00374 family)